VVFQKKKETAQSNRRNGGREGLKRFCQKSEKGGAERGVRGPGVRERGEGKGPKGKFVFAQTSKKRHKVGMGGSQTNPTPQVTIRKKSGKKKNTKKECQAMDCATGPSCKSGPHADPGESVLFETALNFGCERDRHRLAKKAHSGTLGRGIKEKREKGAENQDPQNKGLKKFFQSSPPKPTRKTKKLRQN